jgi:hypothetical protein
MFINLDIIRRYDIRHATYVTNPLYHSLLIDAFDGFLQLLGLAE